MQNATVLVVEDNDLNAMLLKDLLQANGYDTVQAYNGSEAMTLVRARRPDLIVMDIQLPGVSGLDVIRWLKQDDELRRIPVVAVTAFAMPGDEAVIRAAGCDDYLAKPISAKRFLGVVGQHLARRCENLRVIEGGRRD